MAIAVVLLIESDDPRLRPRVRDAAAMVAIHDAIMDALPFHVTSILAAMPELEAAVMLYQHNRTLSDVGLPGLPAPPAGYRAPEDRKH